MTVIGSVSVVQDRDGDGVEETRQLATLDDIAGYMRQYNVMGGFWRELTAYLPWCLSVGSEQWAWTSASVDSTQLCAVVASVGQAPTGSDLVIDLKINGASIFSNEGNRLTIHNGETIGFAGPVGTINPGDRLTLDVIQVGSNDPGCRLAITVAVSSMTPILDATA